jgi:glycylpeptide N-tetradecanoyltransferase
MNEIDDIYLFLKEHYISDEGFKLYYSRNFLKWVIGPDAIVLREYYKDHKDHEDGKDQEDRKDQLIGLVVGIPIKLNNPNKFIEINFLCVHKDHRNNNLASKLLYNLTEIAKSKGYTNAIYTGANVVSNGPMPIAKVYYFHRMLNIPKLKSVGFVESDFVESESESAQTLLSRTTKDDITQIIPKLRKYLSSFDIYPVSFKDLHFQQGVLYSYIIKNSNEITDFICFYQLDTTVHTDSIISLKTGYIYYYFNESVDLCTLVNYAVTEAKKEQFDLINALNIMNNDSFLKESFLQGSGKLYYFNDWPLRNKESSESRLCNNSKNIKIGLMLE